MKNDYIVKNVISIYIFISFYDDTLNAKFMQNKNSVVVCAKYSFLYSKETKGNEAVVFM